VFPSCRWNGDGSTKLSPPAYVTFDPLGSPQIVQMGSVAQQLISDNRDPIPIPKLTSSARWQGHVGFVRCAAFSSDGRKVASGSADGTSRIWDRISSDCITGCLKRHTCDLWSIAFSPDGSQIACGTADYLVRTWNTHTGNEVARPFKGHSGAVWSVVYSTDGKLLASGSIDKTVRLWDVQTGQNCAGPLTGHTGPIASVVFSPDGKTVVSGSDDATIRVWSVKTGALLYQPLVGHKFAVPFAGFSPDGRRIVTGSMDRAFCVWDSRTGALICGPAKRHAEGALAVTFTPNSTSLAVSPDGKWIAGSPVSSNNTLQVWDSKTGNLAATLNAHSKLVWSVTFSPDGKQILSASDDTTLHICNLDY